MTKSASQRRFDKLADDLGALLRGHPERFNLVWKSYVRGWVQEAQRRARSQRQDSTDAPIPAIFSVFEKARGLARAIGAEREVAVAESLIHLKHICAGAVASVTNPKLYRFDTDCTYRLREQFVNDRRRD